MNKDLHKFLLATLRLAKSSLQKKVRRSSIQKKGISILICMCMWNMHRTRRVPGWLKCRGWGRSSSRLLWCLPAPAAAPASVECSLHQVLAGGHPQAPSFPFYIDHGVSEQQTIHCQWPWQTTPDSLVPAWCLSFRSATGCALLWIQPNKIVQQLTVSLDFKSTAGCLLYYTSLHCTTHH